MTWGTERGLAGPEVLAHWGQRDKGQGDGSGLPGTFTQDGHLSRGSEHEYVQQAT